MTNIGLYYPLASTGSPDMTPFLDSHLSGKSQKFVLYWFNVRRTSADVGPALIQHVLTVMSCVCQAHIVSALSMRN